MTVATVLAGLMVASPAWAQNAADDAAATDTASEDVQVVENEDGTVTLTFNGQSITLDAESANEINTALGSANPEDVATAVQNVVARVSASAAAGGGDAAADEAAAAVATFVANRATNASQVEAATRGAIRARPTAAATVTTRVAVSAGAQRTGATAQSLANAVNTDAQIPDEAKQATNTVAQSQEPTAAPQQQQQLAAQPGDENEPNPNQDVSPTN